MRRPWWKRIDWRWIAFTSFMAVAALGLMCFGWLALVELTGHAVELYENENWDALRVVGWFVLLFLLRDISSALGRIAQALEGIKQEMDS